MSNILRAICIIGAFISLGIGAIGVILPFLPTTPFILLSAFLFARGTKRFHIWFLNTKIYKRYIEGVVKSKSMTLKSKLQVILSMSIVFIIAFIFAPIWHARVVILVVAILHLYYFIFKIKTEHPKNLNEKIDKEKEIMNCMVIEYCKGKKHLAKDKEESFGIKKN